MVEALRSGDKPRMMQRFARINIAEAGDDALIEQRDFQRDPFPFARARERRGVEISATTARGPSRAVTDIHRSDRARPDP